MKNEKDRVFAYSLAKEISHADLAEVSGGSAHMSFDRTYHATGGSGQGVDGFVDVKFDW